MKNNKLQLDKGEAHMYVTLKNGIIKVERVPKDEMNFKKLLKKRINIFPLDADIGYSMINKNFKPEKAFKFTHNNNHLRKIAYHIIFSKKIEFLCDCFISI